MEQLILNYDSWAGTVLWNECRKSFHSSRTMSDFRHTCLSTGVKCSDTPNNVNWGKRRQRSCLDSSHYEDIIVYISVCQFLISMAPQKKKKWSTTKAVATWTYIIKQTEMRGAALISLLGSAPGITKSWRVKEKRKKKKKQASFR